VPRYGWAWKASGQACWFERLIGELQFELWKGDAARFSASDLARKRIGNLQS